MALDARDYDPALREGAQIPGESVGAGEIETADLAADSVDGTKIADDAVSLEHLDSGVAPAYIVVAAGQLTTAGGDANEQASASGVLATDIAIASLEDNGTNNVTLVTAAAAADAVDFVLSGDPSTDAIINWMVLRAAS